MKEKMKNLSKFGQSIKILRLESGMSIREISKKVGYDSSNWSKIERGKLSLPSDENMLRNWADILGLKSKELIQVFVDEAKIAQGIIPSDLLDNKTLLKSLPAFFRTVRNKKPNKEEIDKLIQLLKGE